MLSKVTSANGNSAQAVFVAFVKEYTGWLGMRIMCPKGATCLPVDSCFYELAL